MPRLRLRKSKIVKNPRTFDEVFSDGVRHYSKHIILLTTHSHKTQVGFAVSGKIKGAVKRNRAKRRLREIVRINSAALPTNRAIVFVARPGIEGVNFKSLNDDYRNLLDQLV